MQLAIRYRCRRNESSRPAEQMALRDCLNKLPLVIRCKPEGSAESLCDDFVHLSRTDFRRDNELFRHSPSQKDAKVSDACNGKAKPYHG